MVSFAWGQILKVLAMQLWLQNLLLLCCFCRSHYIVVWASCLIFHCRRCNFSSRAAWSTWMGWICLCPVSWRSWWNGFGRAWLCWCSPKCKFALGTDRKSKPKWLQNVLLDTQWCCGFPMPPLHKRLGSCSNWDDQPSGFDAKSPTPKLPGYFWLNESITSMMD